MFTFYNAHCIIVFMFCSATYIVPKIVKKFLNELKYHWPVHEISVDVSNEKVTASIMLNIYIFQGKLFLCSEVPSM